MWLYVVCPAVRISGTEYVEQGETIHLQCNASAHSQPPPRHLHWLHNERPVRSDPSAGVLLANKISADHLLSVLTVEHSRFSDTGEYVCVTSNHDVASMIVHVLTGTHTPPLVHILMTLSSSSQLEALILDFFKCKVAVSK